MYKQNIQQILLKDINSYKDEEISFFFSSHTFEHINARNLNDLLKNIKKKLSKNAIIYIEVPSDNFSKFQYNSKINEGPHISHFTQKSLRLLINKYFDIIDISIRGPKRVLSDNNYQDLNKIYSKKRFLRTLLNKLGILKFAQKISVYYHLFYSKNNEYENLIKSMFFKKNDDENNGSFISVLARNNF